MVAIRKTIESTYIGLCDIIEIKEVVDTDGSNTFKGVTTYIDVPCRLSFEKNQATSINDNVTEVSQNTKLFIAPEVNVKSSSKIIVKQNGVTNSYKNSSQPAIYNTHQEINLELLQEYS